MEPFAHRLVDDGLIEPGQWAWARDRQRRQGGDVGDFLVEAGFISSREYYAALARHWRSAARDLVQQPPEPALLAQLDVEEMIEVGWVGCDFIDDTVVVASCVPPAEDLVVEVQERFPGMPIEFVSCTQADLDALAIRVRRERQARTPARRPPMVHTAHHVLALSCAVVALTAAFVVPLEVLAIVLFGACTVFVAGSIVLSADAYPHFVRELAHDARADPPEVPDHVNGEMTAVDRYLPVYTAIVRLRGGDLAVRALLDNFNGMDYPRARTDAILLVAESDQATLDALRRTTPLPWVRVARVPDDDFTDLLRVYDHGLALARGRYVVAYEQDETPASDQVRRAVAAFEADLVARVDRRRSGPPLVALRVAHRAGRRATPFARLAAADEVLHLDRTSGSSGPLRLPDITSVHCQVRLLRRAGGFGALVGQPGALQSDGTPALRIEDLASTSVRDVVPGPRRWIRDRAEAFASVLSGTPPHLSTGAVPAQEGTILFFLAYPVVLVGVLVTSMRGAVAGEGIARTVVWLGMGWLTLTVLVAIGAAGALLARRGGWLAAVDALALPVHWFLHAAAAWAALVAVLDAALGPSSHRQRAEPS